MFPIEIFQVPTPPLAQRVCSKHSKEGSTRKSPHGNALSHSQSLRPVVEKNNVNNLSIILLKNKYLSTANWTKWRLQKGCFNHKQKPQKTHWRDLKRDNELQVTWTCNGCLTDCVARIFTPIPLFYHSHNKSPVSKITPSNWESVHAAGVPKRVGVLINFSELKKCLAVSGFKPTPPVWQTSA